MEPAESTFLPGGRIKGKELKYLKEMIIDTQIRPSSNLFLKHL